MSALPQSRHSWAGFASTGVRGEHERCSCGLFVFADDRLNVNGLFDAVVAKAATDVPNRLLFMDEPRYLATSAIFWPSLMID
jgi:hypothetical protein